MKELMKQYGGFVLAGIVFMVMLILVFSSLQDGQGNQGVRAILAAHMDTEGIDYDAYNDYDTYSAEGVKEFPKITYQDIGYLPVGTTAFLNQVTAVDYAGRTLEYAGSSIDETERSRGYLKIVKFEDESGNDLGANINADTGEITFPSMGIYEITVCAQDDGCRKSTSVICVAVM